MKARRVLFFVGLIIAVLFFNIGITQAEIAVNNSDIPLDTKCLGSWGFKDAFNAGDWSPAKWGDPDVTKWAPTFAGLKVSKDRRATIRFVFSQEEIDFYSKTFPGANTRIPYSLEISVVDYNQIFGLKEFKIYSSNVFDDTKLKYDVDAYDPEKQMSVFIPRPDQLKPHKVYEIVLMPNEPKTNAAGEVKLNFKLSVNYKWLAAMYYGTSTKCDVLTMIDQVRDELSNDQIKHLIKGEFGSYIPDEAIHGWYYFIAATIDQYVRMFVPVGGKDCSICSDDIENPYHNKSGAGYCHALFNTEAGSEYWKYIKFTGDPKIYYVSKGKLYWIKDENTFYKMGNSNFSNVIEYDKIVTTESTYTDLYYEITNQFPISGTIVGENLIVRVPESNYPAKIYW
ncbi:MAG: hypothetical protein V1688_04510, partial [bacterium]